jgi:hypothetical protein
MASAFRRISFCDELFPATDVASDPERTVLLFKHVSF